MRTVAITLAVILWLVITMAVIFQLPQGQEGDPAFLVGIVFVLLAFTLVAAILGIIKLFNKIHALPEDKRRYMAFGSVPIMANGESIDRFKNYTHKPRAIRYSLQQHWGIQNHGDATAAAHTLSQAQFHAPFADDVYHNLIKKGLTVADFGPALGSLQDKHASQIDRIKQALVCYDKAKQGLIRTGYTEEELDQIPSLAAWDYGRTAFIARFGSNAGLMTQDEAWPYIKAAADNASPIYADWRQYLAAYILGQAVGANQMSALGRRIIGEKSHLARIPFKGE